MGGNKQPQSQSQSQNKKKNPPDAPPNPNSIANREAFQRMNFLFQASTYLNSVDASQPQSHHRGGSSRFPTQPSSADDDLKSGNAIVNEAEASSGNDTRAKGQRRGNRKNPMLSDLSAGYIHDLRTIGNKNVLRIDPSVKRKLCKACNTVLIPGTTARVRIKSVRNNSAKKVVYTCLHCNACRSIPAMPMIPSGEDAMDYDLPDAAIQTSNPSDTVEEASRKKRNPRRRPMKHKSPLLSERRDAGHVVVIGNEAAPFE